MAAELSHQGLRVGHDTVAALLKAEAISLAGTSRTTGVARLPLNRHDWHGTWNYTLSPEPLRPEHPAPATEFGRSSDGDEASVWLAHPSLTGLEPAAWTDLFEHYTRYRADHPPVVIEAGMDRSVYRNVPE